MSKEKLKKEASPKTYLITSEQLMDIMRYLMTRPYGEVVNIMNSLSKLSPLDSRISAEFVKQGESNDGKERR
jgi:hypothetical protein|tara:strand:- start:417 stop:632 length:216 start_codon:yes stop_codon:yes gene_type:complete